MVYTMSKRVNPSINAISTLVVVFITIVLIIVNVAPMVKEKRKAQSTEMQEKKKAPRIIAAVVAACVFMGLVFVQKTGISSKKYAGQTLHVYNAGEYTGENLKNKQDVKLLWIFLIQMNKCILK